MGAVYSDPNRDTAILMINPMEAQRISAPQLSFGGEIDSGGSVCSFGFACGKYPAMFLEGLAINYIQEEGFCELRFNRHIIQGMSGGPILDKYGQVVGLNSSSYMDAVPHPSVLVRFTNFPVDMGFGVAVSEIHTVVALMLEEKEHEADCSQTAP